MYLYVRKFREQVDSLMIFTATYIPGQSSRAFAGGLRSDGHHAWPACLLLKLLFLCPGIGDRLSQVSGLRVGADEADPQLLLSYR